MKKYIYNYLEVNYSDLLKFWCRNSSINFGKYSIQEHCDLLYTLYLINDLHLIHKDSLNLFIKYLESVDFPGWKIKNPKEDKPISIHNLAYLLGSLNLIKGTCKIDLYEKIFSKRKYVEKELFKLRNNMPSYPFRFSFHNWRVSHWLGGVPSILLSLGNSNLTKANYYRNKAIESFKRTSNLFLHQETGLIRIYKLELIYKIFNFFYQIRHKPKLGEIGGIAHVLWINYILDMPIKGSEWIKHETASIYLKSYRYMEDKPYCLDFDIVQAVRITHMEEYTEKIIERSKQMMKDLEFFFQQDLNSDYPIHKLPGALATYHECGLICGIAFLQSLNVEPIDIIKSAFWI